VTASVSMEDETSPGLNDIYPCRDSPSDEIPGEGILACRRTSPRKACPILNSPNGMSALNRFKCHDGVACRGVTHKLADIAGRIA
jgi:hypothetical protein